MKTPKDDHGRIDKDRVHRLYMESPHVSWTSFAESLGWNASRMRSEFPVLNWIEEKRKLLQSTASERISELLFREEGRWHTEVLEALQEFPELGRQLFHILTKKVQSLESRDISKIPTSELVKLAQAFKIMTEAQHSALLIDRWTFEAAIQASKEVSDEPSRESSTHLDTEVTINNGDGTRTYATAAELQKMFSRWYDQPPTSAVGSDG